MDTDSNGRWPGIGRSITIVSRAGTVRDAPVGFKGHRFVAVIRDREPHGTACLFDGRDAQRMKLLLHETHPVDFDEPRFDTRVNPQVCQCAGRLETRLGHVPLAVCGKSRNWRIASDHGAATRSSSRTPGRIRSTSLRIRNSTSTCPPGKFTGQCMKGSSPVDCAEHSVLGRQRTLVLRLPAIHAAVEVPGVQDR